MTAFHGDIDTHPAAGVIKPLSALGERFRMTVFAKCGHDPWKERYARDVFLESLTKEIISGLNRHCARGGDVL